LALARDGEAVAGTLKCSVGSSQITYRLSARADAHDAEAHTAVISVAGKEARGSGTLTATITVEVRPEGSGSRLDVSADIEASGRGEAADEAAWSRVLSRLVDAHLATVARAEPMAEAAPPVPAPPVPAPAEAVPPRPALSVAAASGDFGSAGSDGTDDHRALLGGVVFAGLLLLMRRRRKRRRADRGQQ
jgi:carbon monoxide dehydrogenase subunit G